MRLLTYEQQAKSLKGQHIGGLDVQSEDLSNGSNGSNYTRDVVSLVIPFHAATWRDAVAIGLVSRSRYGEWEPFRTKSGHATTHLCDEGRAFATDGVHIIIQTIDGNWISRSSQVIHFRVEVVYGGQKQTTRVRADKVIKGRRPSKQDNLMAEYLSI